MTSREKTVVPPGADESGKPLAQLGLFVVDKQDTLTFTSI